MYKKKSNTYQDVIDFITKNWVFLVGIILLFPYISKYIKQQNLSSVIQDTKLSAKETFNTNLSPIAQQSAADKITKSKTVQAAANSLANDLGTKFLSGDTFSDIFELKSWTENDAKVAKTLIYQRNNYSLLVKLYYNCYTAKRNLTNDILKYLDATELTKVRKYLKI